MNAYIRRLRDRRGATAVIVAVVIVVLIEFAALALDVGHLTLVRGELQNAADAGALAGARVLLTTDAGGNEIVNPGAKAEAQRVALQNKSDNKAVEVDLAADVRLGHWDGTTFTPGTPGNEADPTYINAVEVTTHRSSAYSIFATIFGINSFSKRGSAVAYRGWAGSDVEFDMPIAVCWDMLVDGGGKYVCTTGRMFSNGGGSSTVGTARWTNFSEECVSTANQPSVTDQVNLGCSGGITPISVTTISTNNGEMTPSLTAVYDCWLAATGRTTSWMLTLPVVSCVEPPTCSQIVGAVKVKVVWVTANGSDPQYNRIPLEMDGWSQSTNCTGIDLSTVEGRQQCWTNFATNFNLTYMNPDGTTTPATYQPATVYFVPSCEYESLGGPGGEEFNVHAQYPKLVQ